MKKAEIKELNEIIAEIDTFVEKVRDLSEKYQDKFDNASEAWQEGDRGDACQELIDNLDAAADSLEEASGCLNEAVDSEI